MITGERQSARMRTKYLHAMLSEVCSLKSLKSLVMDLCKLVLVPFMIKSWFMGTLWTAQMIPSIASRCIAVAIQ